MHRTELLAKLIEEGRLTGRRGPPQRSSFHDPCYLGRHNGIYDAPRPSSPRSRARAQGDSAKPRQRVLLRRRGGRFWLDEKLGTRINQERFKEIEASGTDAVGVSCPFCMVMVGNARTELGGDDGALRRPRAGGLGPPSYLRKRGPRPRPELTLWGHGRRSETAGRRTEGTLRPSRLDSAEARGPGGGCPRGAARHRGNERRAGARWTAGSARRPSSSCSRKRTRRRAGRASGASPSPSSECSLVLAVYWRDPGPVREQVAARLRLGGHVDRPPRRPRLAAPVH